MTRNPGRLCAVVTADIIGSTKYHQENGTPIRPRILAALEQINTRYAEALSVPFAITIGDEFQGLTDSPSVCPLIIYHLRLLLSPLKCRIGIGIGPIVSGLARTTVEMEGPAFSYSRDAIDALKNRKVAITAYHLGDTPELTPIVNDLSALIDIIQNSWTHKQWEAVRLYDELSDLAAAASRLGITSQSVDDRLQATHWREVSKASGRLSELLHLLLNGSGRTS